MILVAPIWIHVEKQLMLTGEKDFKTSRKHVSDWGGGGAGITWKAGNRLFFILFSKIDYKFNTCFSEMHGTYILGTFFPN